MALEVSHQGTPAVRANAHSFLEQELTRQTGSFAGLFYLSLYLAAKLHIWDCKGEVWKVFAVVIPSIGAGLIAASRIMDARHHPFDVITGSLLGMACAYASYRQYFPAISDTRCKGRAYPIRSWGGGQVTEDAGAPSSAYEGVNDVEDVEATPGGVQPSRQGTSDSQAPLARFAAPFTAESREMGRERYRGDGNRNDYGSSSGEEEYELQESYRHGAAADKKARAT